MTTISIPYYECDLFEWADRQQRKAETPRWIDEFNVWFEGIMGKLPVMPPLSPAPVTSTPKPPYSIVDPALPPPEPFCEADALYLASLDHEDPFAGVFEMADLMDVTWLPVQQEDAENKLMQNRITQQRRRVAKAQATKPYTKKDVDALLDLQDRRCGYCGIPFNGNDFQIDHMLAVSKGGTNDVENIILACQPCNNAKGAMLLDEWKFNRGW